MEILIVLLVLLLPIVLSYFLIKMNKKCKKLKKYEPIINYEDKISELKKAYQDKKVIYDTLKDKIAIYTEDIELIELGFYNPQFDFDDAETYKAKITEIKSHQKEMMMNKTAIICRQEWVLEGSKSKGKTMTNRNIRLISRAFNNECDATIAKVKWNNIQKSKERIVRAYESINKLSESNAINIVPEYLDLKLKELSLTHEYKEKKQAEKEEQAEIRQQMREETKLEQEILKAQKEEEKYVKLLEKAKLDAEKATGERLAGLQSKMAKLEVELAEAHNKNVRAKSMAEQTRAGHVYVISNIGSFGENIYKIGMTRRLEPLDRVKELGDASVPFLFDIHAMIYSDDAPSMEKKLHNAFNHKRVNLVNNRKEFFNVSLQEIKEESFKHKESIEFIETIEAREYTESMAIRTANQEKLIENIEIFPESI